VSLNLLLNSHELDKSLTLNIFTILINDIQMLIHTIPKCNYTANSVSNEDLNLKEKYFLMKMNRLKALVSNYKLRHEI
jgi:hypothetical protein